MTTASGTVVPGIDGVIFTIQKLHQLKGHVWTRRDRREWSKGRGRRMKGWGWEEDQTDTEYANMRSIHPSQMTCIHGHTKYVITTVSCLT